MNLNKERAVAAYTESTRFPRNLIMKSCWAYDREVIEKIFRVGIGMGGEIQLYS